MATQSPFLWLQNLAQSLSSDFPAPAWAVDEVQRRVVLLLNHVLLQEPAATNRLLRQAGSVVELRWRSFSIRCVVTRAGLLDLAASGSSPDLSLDVTDESPVAIAQAMLRGGKPAVHIHGDVQLAAELNWVVDNVRWDIEEDLSRVVGDGAAHALGQMARRIAVAVRQFAGPGSAPAAGATKDAIVADTDSGSR